MIKKKYSRLCHCKVIFISICWGKYQVYFSEMSKNNSVRCWLIIRSEARSITAMLVRYLCHAIEPITWNEMGFGQATFRRDRFNLPVVHDLTPWCLHKTDRTNNGYGRNAGVRSRIITEYERNESKYVFWHAHLPPNKETRHDSLGRARLKLDKLCHCRQPSFSFSVSGGKLITNQIKML